MNTKESTITLDELSVKVVRKNIKRFHLAVYPPDGRVRISVPERVDDQTVRAVVREKLSWIREKAKTVQQRPRQSAEMVSGESHYYLGQRYVLDVVRTEKRPFVEMNETLVLHVNEDTGTEQRRRLLINWYRKEMNQVLPDIVSKWELKSRLRVHYYGIKSMKTRWGSCNPARRRIWLNLELIKKPLHCLEYVVVHEIVHFLERTHNDLFTFHMDRLMPQWRTFCDELNRGPLPDEGQH